MNDHRWEAGRRSPDLLHDLIRRFVCHRWGHRPVDTTGPNDWCGSMECGRCKLVMAP